MTIERSNADRVQFKTLRCGDVFIDERGSVLMRTESVYNGDDGEYNAVNLEDGLLYIYDEILYVEKKPTAILKI
jgi:hypothetical protein